MNKKLLIFSTAVLLSLSLSIGVFAEFIPCLSNPNQSHTFSEWAETGKNDNGGSIMERACSSCDYIQTGMGMEGTDKVATTRMPVASTTSIDAPLSSNPATGAIA